MRQRHQTHQDRCAAILAYYQANPQAALSATGTALVVGRSHSNLGPYRAALDDLAEQGRLVTRARAGRGRPVTEYCLAARAGKPVKG